MHSKQKGNIGSSAVVYILNKLGFNVFHELGDYSKIDLIAEKDGKLIKIQVKYSKIDNGTIKLNLRKTGPNGYCYRYSTNDVDYFALYCKDDEKVYFIKSEVACKNINNFTLRLQDTLNNQTYNTHLAKDFEKLEI